MDTTLENLVEELFRIFSELEKDANRYRWLRDKQQIRIAQDSDCWVIENYPYYCSADNLDVLIDRAMAHDPKKSIKLQVENILKATDENC